MPGTCVAHSKSKRLKNFAFFAVKKGSKIDQDGILLPFKQRFALDGPATSWGSDQNPTATNRYRPVHRF